MVRLKCPGTPPGLEQVEKLVIIHIVDLLIDTRRTRVGCRINIARCAAGPDLVANAMVVAGNETTIIVLNLIVALDVDLNE
jgi:hypothetical protein